MSTDTCKHTDHHVDVDVSYMEDSGHWIASFKLRCSQCNEPYRFLGLPAGMSFTHPTVSITGTELHVPMEPEGTPELHSHASFEMPPVVGDPES